MDAMRCKCSEIDRLLAGLVLLLSVAYSGRSSGTRYRRRPSALQPFCCSLSFSPPPPPPSQLHRHHHCKSDMDAEDSLNGGRMDVTIDNDNMAWHGPAECGPTSGKTPSSILQHQQHTIYTMALLTDVVPSYCSLTSYRPPNAPSIYGMTDLQSWDADDWLHHQSESQPECINTQSMFFAARAKTSHLSLAARWLE